MFKTEIPNHALRGGRNSQRSSGRSGLPAQGAGEKDVSELSPARRDFRLYERDRSTNDENATRYHLASAGAGPSHLRPNDGNRPQESGFWKDPGNNQQGQRGRCPEEQEPIRDLHDG